MNAPTFAARTSSREWPGEVQAVMDAIAKRLTWPSIHWGTERVHDDAWPHIAATALDAAMALPLPAKTARTSQDAESAYELARRQYVWTPAADGESVTLERSDVPAIVNREAFVIEVSAADVEAMYLELRRLQLGAAGREGEL